MDYKKLKSFYNENYKLSHYGNNIENKLLLVGLICYLTEKHKKSNHKITYEIVINKLTKDSNLTNKEKVALCLICENFAYGCNKFERFGINEQEIPMKIKELLKNYCPF